MSVDVYQSPPDAVYGLWYYPMWNRFTDEDGNIIHDLSELFHLWQIEQWKDWCRDNLEFYGQLTDKRGNLVELYYLDDDLDEDTADHIRTHAFLYREHNFDI